MCSIMIDFLICQIESEVFISRSSHLISEARVKENQNSPGLFPVDTSLWGIVSCLWCRFFLFFQPLELTFAFLASRKWPSQNTTDKAFCFHLLGGWSFLRFFCGTTTLTSHSLGMGLLSPVSPSSMLFPLYQQGDIWAPQVVQLVKSSAASAGDTRDAGSFPESGRSPGVECGNPFQYSYLENSMDRGAWWATVHGVKKSWTCLSDRK